MDYGHQWIHDLPDIHNWPNNNKKYSQYDIAMKTTIMLKEQQQHMLSIDSEVIFKYKFRQPIRVAYLVLPLHRFHVGSSFTTWTLSVDLGQALQRFSLSNR